MAGADVVLHFSVTPRLKLVGAPHEYDPIVVAYLSGYLTQPGSQGVDPIFVRSEPFTERLTTQIIKLEAELSSDLQELPLSTSLGLQALAQMQSEENLTCAQSVGLSRLYVKDLQSIKAGDTMEVRLNPAVSDAQSKGSLLLRFLEAPIFRKPFATRALDPEEDLPEHHERIDALINAAGEAGYTDLDRSGYHPSVAVLRDVVAPWWNTPISHASGAMFFVFDRILPRPGSQEHERLEAYWLHVFRVILRRHDMTEEDFTTAVANQLATSRDRDTAPLPDTYAILSILGEGLTAFANALPYIGDYVDENTFGRKWNAKYHRLVEIFSKLRLIRSGDCEDLAREILLGYDELTRGGPWQSSLLTAVRRFLGLFVPMAVLGAVTQAAASTSAGEKQEDESNYMGHMWAMLFTNPHFVDMVRASGTKVPTDFLDKLMQAAGRNPSIRGGRPEDAPLSCPRWLSAIPPMVLEGTGRVTAVPVPLHTLMEDLSLVTPVREAQQYNISRRQSTIDAHGDIEFVAQSMQPPRGFEAKNLKELRIQAEKGDFLNDFYRYAVHGFTAVPKRAGCAFLEYVFVDTQRKTYGVPYGSLVSGSSQLALRPAPPLSPEAVRASRHMMMHLMPDVFLQAPSSEECIPSLNQARNAVLETYGGDTSREEPGTDFYVTHRTAESSKHMARLTSLVQNLRSDSQIQQLACVMEPLTPDVGAMRLRIVSRD